MRCKAGNCGYSSLNRIWIPPFGSSLTFQVDDQHNEINDEQQNYCHFEPEHHPIALIGFEQLVKVVERLELAVNGAVPFGEMKTRREFFVNARQMPVAEKLCDVRQLVVEPGQVNPNLPQPAKNIRARTERRSGRPPRSR
jgi:hypothetical protein